MQTHTYADTPPRDSPTRTLSVGIGCRANSAATDIETAVRIALGAYAFEQIGTVATIDSKAHEAGLLEFCARHALPLQLFSRAQIAAMPVASPSAAAQAHLGVDGVCEPCALLAASHAASSTDANNATPNNTTSHPADAAHSPRLLVRKTRHAGITVAIACTSNAAHDAAGPNPAATHRAPPNQDSR
ncbi:cobalamin biosynthesis protein [Paraburkholderia antibiotica]|nr:cobalamin biosynthesis protein [Paraburkholderia antibiotica]